MDCIGTRACPSSAVFNNHKSVYPTCGVKPGNDPVKYIKPPGNGLGLCMMMSATTMETTPAAEQRGPKPGRADVSAISFQNVSKYFSANDNSRLEVLRDISFSVPDGQIV